MLIVTSKPPSHSHWAHCQLLFPPSAPPHGPFNFHLEVSLGKPLVATMLQKAVEFSAPVGSRSYGCLLIASWMRWIGCGVRSSLYCCILNFQRLLFWSYLSGHPWSAVLDEDPISDFHLCHFVWILEIAIISVISASTYQCPNSFCPFNVNVLPVITEK